MHCQRFGLGPGRAGLLSPPRFVLCNCLELANSPSQSHQKIGPSVRPQTHPPVRLSTPQHTFFCGRTNPTQTNMSEIVVFLTDGDGPMQKRTLTRPTHPATHPFNQPTFPPLIFLFPISLRSDEHVRNADPIRSVLARFASFHASHSHCQSHQPANL